MNQENKFYRKAMFRYGIHTLLFVLEHFESKENYEECKKIIDAIQEQEDRLDIKLFTRISNESIKDTIETYKKHNLTGVNMIENSKYYASLIIEELNLDKTNK